MIGLLELAGVSALMLSLASWLFVVGFRLLRDRLGRAEPGAAEPGKRGVQVREGVARLWLYAPFWVPLFVLLGAFLPGVFGAFPLTEGLDHCLSHTESHHHLCFSHPPHQTGKAWSWLAQLGLLGVGVGVLLPIVRRLFLELRLTHTLIEMSRTMVPPGACSGAHNLHAPPEVRWLEQEQALALAAGLFRPVILLSTGLAERVDKNTLDVVLAHEQAHLQRRDTVLAMCDRIAASFLPDVVSRPLLEDIELARELACDQAAAAAVGSPLLVAKALTQVARARLSVPAVGVSLGGASITTRVMVLLNPVEARQNAKVTVLFALALMIAAGAVPVHQTIEFIFFRLFH